MCGSVALRSISCTAAAVAAVFAGSKRSLTAATAAAAATTVAVAPAQLNSVVTRFFNIYEVFLQFDPHTLPVHPIVETVLV